MMGTLGSKAASAELFSDVAESTMFSAEAGAVCEAVAERRREFATVRFCAHRALRRIGVPAVPVLPGPDGTPRWPAGVVGSMTHCAGYRAAAVALSRDLRSLGIDAEPHLAVPTETLDLIAGADERAQFEALADARPNLHWDRILFCAKEALFKAWFPLTHLWLGFADLAITMRLDGTFCAHVDVPAPRDAGTGLRTFTGRWAVDRGLIVAATWVPGPGATSKKRAR